jgi:hypothetical protein
MIPIYLLSSASLASMENYLFRRSLEKGAAPNAYLSLYYLVSLLVSLILYPKWLDAQFSPVIALLGCIAGFLNFLMLKLTAKSFELGPPGLTITFQNASCIFPGLLLCLVFGSQLGFILTPRLVTGFGLIIVGLYISSFTFGKVSNATAMVQSNANFRKWLLYAVSVMLLQGSILTLFQWRVLLFYPLESSHWLIPWSCSAEEDVWFIPAFFLVPALCQFFLFWKGEKRKFSLSEMRYGSISGGLNCICTILLLLATKTDGILKKEMLFPIFTVSVILICNLWGMKSYKEKVNWKGIIICILGVLIGLI